MLDVTPSKVMSSIRAPPELPFCGVPKIQLVTFTFLMVMCFAPRMSRSPLIVTVAPEAGWKTTSVEEVFDASYLSVCEPYVPEASVITSPGAAAR